MFLFVDIAGRQVTEPQTEEEFTELTKNSANFCGFRIDKVEGKKPDPFPYKIFKWRDLEGYYWKSSGGQATLELAIARCYLDTWTWQMNEVMDGANWVSHQYNQMAEQCGFNHVRKQSIGGA